MRRLGFATAMLLGVVVFVEALSWIALSLLAGEETSIAGVRASRSALLGNADSRAGDVGGGAGEWNGVVLHPFLGYVLDPSRSNVHGFGFKGPEGFFFDDPDTVVVAITGGSVSQQLWKRSRDLLKEQLSKVPEFQGRPMQIISLGV